MARLIDAEFIEKWINREDHNTPDERWRPESEFAAMVDNAPTVDAAPVVHGEWIMYNNDTLFARTLVCSNCNHIRVVSGDNPGYCERCGAKMDGGDE